MTLQTGTCMACGKNPRRSGSVNLFPSSERPATFCAQTLETARGSHAATQQFSHVFTKKTLLAEKKNDRSGFSSAFCEDVSAAGLSTVTEKA